MVIIKKKIKYTKTKYRAYSLLNDVAHSFIESSGGYVVSNTNLSLQSTEGLEFLVSDLLNYKLYDNTTQFQVKVDEYQLAYTKYGRDGSTIDVSESNRYPRGRGNYSI